MVFCISGVARPSFDGVAELLDDARGRAAWARPGRRTCWPRNRRRRPPPWSAGRATAACGSCSAPPAPRSLPVGDQRAQDGDVLERRVHGLAQHRGVGFAAAAVRHAGHLGAAAQHEQLAREMRQAAGAGVRVVDLAGIGLGVVDELLDRLPGRRRMHHQDLEALGDPDDRHEVLDRVVAGAAPTPPGSPRACWCCPSTACSRRAARSRPRARRARRRRPAGSRPPPAGRAWA